MSKRWFWILAAVTLLAISGGAAAAAQTTAITLAGSGTTTEGGGVTIDGSTITITQEGTYALSGTLDGGQILVDAGKGDIVELVLDGAAITSRQTAAIYAKQAGQLILTLAEGTSNTLTDAAADERDDESGAALYARHNLLIRGAGTLTVRGNDQNGITARDNLVIESGRVTVAAVSDGLRGKDSVTLLGGSLIVEAGSDGIVSEGTGDKQGIVRIAGGAVNITSMRNGIRAQRSLAVSGGALMITAGGGYANASCAGKDSGKGLQSDGSIAVTGGALHVNALDDALHAADAVEIAGGTLRLLSGDDGIHAGASVTITGGAVEVAVSLEGIESRVIRIQGGFVSVLSSDDGLNAVDTSRSGLGDGTPDSSLQIHISGGEVTINAYGDGLDSNGTVTISGGALAVSAAASAGYNAIDANGAFTLSGGTLIAADAGGMAQPPGQSSAQASVQLRLRTFQPPGATCYLTDENGNVMLSYTANKPFQSILFSAPGLVVGGAYRVYAGESGSPDSATLLAAFTQEAMFTAVGDMQPQRPQ